MGIFDYRIIAKNRPIAIGAVRSNQLNFKFGFTGTVSDQFYVSTITVSSMFDPSSQIIKEVRIVQGVNWIFSSVDSLLGFSNIFEFLQAVSNRPVLGPSNVVQWSLD